MEEEKKKREEKEKVFQAAVGELLEHATDPVSKKVIGTYSYKSSYNTNMKKMKGSTVAELERAATSLEMKLKHEDDTKIHKNKDVLVDRIILKIESHFDTTCDGCGADYRIKIGDEEPLQRCYLCHQGAHNCDALTTSTTNTKDLTLPAGFVWICHGCRIKNDLFKKPGKKRKQSVTFADNPAAAGEEITKKPGDNEEEPEEEEEEEDEEVEEEDEKEPEEAEEDRPSPRRDIVAPTKGNKSSTATKENKSEEPKPNKDSNPSKDSVCPKYKRNNCPHGRSGTKKVEGQMCEYKHPPLCQPFCKYGNKEGGCKKGTGCEFYHPKHCKFSVKNGECSNRDCTYTHLVGTIRSFRKSYRKEERGPPPRSRKDSMASVSSLTSESYRTPFPRHNKGNYKKQQDGKPGRNNLDTKEKAFLDLLMENMKKGFDEQREEIGNLKKCVDEQISAIWKQVKTSKPPGVIQLPPSTMMHPYYHPVAPQQWNQNC